MNDRNNTAQYQTPAIFISRVCNSVKNSLGQYNVWSTSANNCNVIIGHFWTKCFLVKTSEVDKKGPFSMALIYMTAGQGACHPRHNNTKSTSLLCLNIPHTQLWLFWRKNLDICFLWDRGHKSLCSPILLLLHLIWLHPWEINQNGICRTVDGTLRQIAPSNCHILLYLCMSLLFKWCRCLNWPF